MRLYDGLRVVTKKELELTTEINNATIRHHNTCNTIKFDSLSCDITAVIYNGKVVCSDVPYACFGLHNKLSCGMWTLIVKDGAGSCVRVSKGCGLSEDLFKSVISSRFTGELSFSKMSYDFKRRGTMSINIGMGRAITYVSEYLDGCNDIITEVLKVHDWGGDVTITPYKSDSDDSLCVSVSRIPPVNI